MLSGLPYIRVAMHLEVDKKSHHFNLPLETKAVGLPIHTHSHTRHTPQTVEMSKMDLMNDRLKNPGKREENRGRKGDL